MTDVVLFDRLAGIPLFANFSACHLAELLERASVVDAAAGQSIIRQGDEGNSLYVVLEGTLRVSTDDDQHRRVDRRTLASSDWFGDISLLDAGPRSAAVDSLCAAPDAASIWPGRRSSQLLTYWVPVTQKVHATRRADQGAPLATPTTSRRIWVPD